MITLLQLLSLSGDLWWAKSKEQFKGKAFKEEKAFCFELINSTDFMLGISFFPTVLEVTFGGIKKIKKK